MYHFQFKNMETERNGNAYLCVCVRLGWNQTEFPHWVIIFLIKAVFRGAFPTGTTQVIAQ